MNTIHVPQVVALALIGLAASFSMITVHAMTSIPVQVAIAGQLVRPVDVLPATDIRRAARVRQQERDFGVSPSSARSASSVSSSNPCVSTSPMSASASSVATSVLHLEDLPAIQRDALLDQIRRHVCPVSGADPAYMDLCQRLLKKEQMKNPPKVFKGTVNPTQLQRATDAAKSASAASQR